MINLISYFLFFAGNLLLVFFVPENISKVFLSKYAFYSLFLGPINFIFISKFFTKKNYFLISTIIINIFFIFFKENFLFIIFIYVINIFFSDFLFSQIKYQKINFYYKLLSFFISLLLTTGYFEFLLVLKLKILLSAVFYVLVLFKNYEYNSLDVKSPILYQIFTNINYYLPLFIVSIYTEINSLKTTYLVFQISFSILLKFDDLRIRRIVSNNFYNFIDSYLLYFVLILSLILIFLQIHYLLILMYYINVILFIQIKKKLI